MSSNKPKISPRLVRFCLNALAFAAIFAGAWVFLGSEQHAADGTATRAIAHESPNYDIREDKDARGTLDALRAAYKGGSSASALDESVSRGESRLKRRVPSARIE